jgi:hypothetical protein
MALNRNALGKVYTEKTWKMEAEAMKRGRAA